MQLRFVIAVSYFASTMHQTREGELLLFKMSSWSKPTNCQNVGVGFRCFIITEKKQRKCSEIFLIKAIKPHLKGLLSNSRREKWTVCICSPSNDFWFEIMRARGFAKQQHLFSSQINIYHKKRWTIFQIYS